MQDWSRCTHSPHKEEEKEIVVSLQVLQEIGFGLTKELAGIVIRDYLKDQPERPNPSNFLGRIGGVASSKDGRNL